MTQSKLASLIEKPQSLISNYENYKHKPNSDSLLLLNQAFGLVGKRNELKFDDFIKREK